MHLDCNRALEIEILSGWNEIRTGQLQVRAATAGLRLQTSEAKVASGSLELSGKSEAGIIRFSAMDSGSIVRLRLPFTLEHEVNNVSLRVEISYTTDKGTFLFVTSPTVSIMLPLGVNVQDVFKHEALFSKFTITSATSNPLRLLNSKLKGSEVFEAQSGIMFTRPVVIFPRQPASILYKISRSPSSVLSPRTASRKGTKSSLSLVLNYICLEEEIENAVIQHLKEALEGGPVYPYLRLVLPAVAAELRAHLSPWELERTAILNEVATSFIAAVRWRDHFDGLGYSEEQNQDIPTFIENVLRAWQQQTPMIALVPIPIDDDTLESSRSIVIPVDVPSVTVVHTADIKLLTTSAVPDNTYVAASNQPIPASLSIKWTRIWDTEPGLPNAISSEVEELEFFYEVSGPPDTWLIGGKRKSHFRVPGKAQADISKQKLSFPVVLIPLREGYLPFPNVDIKPAPNVARPGSASTEDSTTRIKPLPTCETDFKNSGETIRVISDAYKTTVSLDASGPQGGTWLLESERRSAEHGRVVLA